MDAPDVKPLVVHRCHAAAYSIFMLVSSLKLQLTQCLPRLTIWRRSFWTSWLRAHVTIINERQAFYKVDLVEVHPSFRDSPFIFYSPLAAI